MGAASAGPAGQVFFTANRPNGMRKTKRSPSNTVASLVDAMQAALAGDIEPPDCVLIEEGDRPFWAAIMRARARAEWTEADLIHAANLARCMAEIDSESRLLRAEGAVITNEKGTPVVNPRHTVLERLSGRSLALTRILQMQSAASGKAEDKVKARQAERGARAAAKTLEDDLIPT